MKRSYFNLTKMILLATIALTLITCDQKEPPKTTQLVPKKAVVSQSDKIRTIIQSDAEIDDQNSLCRLLLYSNEIEIVNIFYNTTGGGAYEEWGLDRITSYGEIRDNLLVHAEGYPTADDMLSRLKRWDDPQAVKMVIDVLLDDNPRPVWYQIWGPGEPLLIGEVMKELKKYEEADRQKAFSKLKLFSIWSQSLNPCCGEDGRASWFPGQIFTINSKDQFKTIAYRNDWKNPVDATDAYYISDVFQQNFEDHGALSDWYLGPKKGRSRTLEGDSPAFLHLLPVGLRSHEDPSYGGWGGRFAATEDPLHFVGAYDKVGNPESYLYKPMSRWFEGSQNDYAARCDWANTSSYDSANHEPVVIVDQEVDINTTPGTKLSFSAAESYDPDGDNLTFKWWQYEDADTYEGSVSIEGNLSSSASITVPEDIEDDSIHIILEVQDDGEPKLTRYKRIIITKSE